MKKKMISKNGFCLIVQRKIVDIINLSSSYDKQLIAQDIEETIAIFITISITVSPW